MDDEGGTGTVRLAIDPADWFAHKLRSLFEAVITELPHALDPTQIEGIHSMRVATRRLRSALRDIELLVDKRATRTASKGFTVLAATLGAVRDEDVAIDEFEKLSAACDIERVRDGVAKLAAVRRERRDAAYAELRKDLSVDFQQDLRRRFETSLESLLEEFTQSQYTDVHAFGRDVISSLLKELSELSVGLHDPFDWKTLHKARISTKRLRYAIDLFAECWGDPIKPFSKECARMQGFLGDAHDRDVWMGGLHKLIKARSHSDSGPDPEYDTAVWLISEFVKERTKNYRDALRLWADWRSRGFGRSLLEAIAPE